MANRLIEQASLAKKASLSLRNVPEEKRNAVLKRFAELLEQQEEVILEANEEDMRMAEASGTRTNMLDRLKLDEKRMASIREGILQVADLPDPLHQVLEERVIQSGIKLKKVSVPMGVIGVIFESRPNVSADCIALCFKAGSACVLKGGKESYQSCSAITACMRAALKEYGLDENLAVLAEKPSHEETAEFMADREHVDLLIPRGGKNLIRSVVQNAKIPVIETGAGVCHVFVDESADPEMAEKIIINAKCQRPSVCNAMETLLVHESLKETFLPHILQVMQEKGVVIYGDYPCIACNADVRPANEESYFTEYNDLIMNVKVVKDVQAAIDHINHYGTHHSESIITKDDGNAEKFLTEIDSACLYRNASTRFTDGFEFGLGAEIGISTQKLHARGPMGLKELTTYAYILEGNGEVR